MSALGIAILVLLLLLLVAILLAVLALVLRRRRHRGPPGNALPPGAVAPDVPVPTAAARASYRQSFARAAGATATAGGDVVWTEGENELLVHAAAVRVVFLDGFVLVGIPVFTEQSGDVEIVVPFATGRVGAPLGLVVATESAPRGPAAIVEPWGDQLAAAAWWALVNVTTGVAAAAGVDARNEVLVPASLVARAGGLTITPQARHRFDQVAS
jgi:hypothetical protein